MHEPATLNVAPARRRFWQSPALIALVLQILALLPTLLCAQLLIHLTARAPGWWMLALLQGAWAALFAWWRQLDVWWAGIMFVFPFAFLLVFSLHLPPWLFLSGFLFFLVLFWASFRTQVPYFPSNVEVWQEVLKHVPANGLSGAPSVADVGSGFGGLLFYLHQHAPHARYCGIELAPLPWLVSYLRARLRGLPVEFLWKDYETLDFAAFDLIFAYLSPAAMPSIWEKARAEMRPGSLLLSYEFVIPGQEPDFKIQLERRRLCLYGWRF